MSNRIIGSHIFPSWSRSLSFIGKALIINILGIRIFSWYKRYLVSLVIFHHLLNIHAYGVSLVNPSLCLYAIYSVLHRTLFLSLASSPSCFHRLTPPPPRLYQFCSCFNILPGRAGFAQSSRCFKCFRTGHWAWNCSFSGPYSSSYGPHPSGSFYIMRGEGGQGASASSSK